MKLKKALAALFISALVVFVGGTKTFAMNTGFSTSALSAEEEQNYKENRQIKLLTEEPQKKAIDCFDVSDNGLIAVGTGAGVIRTICVYNTEGKFQYGYSFESWGSYGLEWDYPNLLIHIVRSDVAVSADPDGNITEIRRIDDTKKNEDYWDYILHSKERKVGDSVYTIKNNMKIIDFFTSAKTQLIVSSSDGNEKIIYDVSTLINAKRIAIAIGILFFFLFSFYVSARQRKNNSHTA